MSCVQSWKFHRHTYTHTKTTMHTVNISLPPPPLCPPNTLSLLHHFICQTLPPPLNPPNPPPSTTLSAKPSHPPPLYHLKSIKHFPPLYMACNPSYSRRCLEVSIQAPAGIAHSLPYGIPIPCIAFKTLFKTHYNYNGMQVLISVNLSLISEILMGFRESVLIRVCTSIILGNTQYTTLVHTYVRMYGVEVRHWWDSPCDKRWWKSSSWWHVEMMKMVLVFK